VLNKAAIVIRAVAENATRSASRRASALIAKTASAVAG